MSEVSPEKLQDSMQNMNLKSLVKTIEGELQTALYYNSNAVFAKDDDERLWHLKKVYNILEMVKDKLDGYINSSIDLK